MSWAPTGPAPDYGAPPCSKCKTSTFVLTQKPQEGVEPVCMECETPNKMPYIRGVWRVGWLGADVEYGGPRDRRVGPLE